MNLLHKHSKLVIGFFGSILLLAAIGDVGSREMTVTGSLPLLVDLMMQYSRMVLYISLGIIVSIYVATSTKSIAFGASNYAPLVFFLFQLGIFFKVLLADDVEYAVQVLFMACTTLIFFFLTANSLIVKFKLNLRSFLLIGYVFSILFLMINVALLIYGSGVYLINDRYTGISPNPIFLGYYTAVGMIFIFWHFSCSSGLRKFIDSILICAGTYIILQTGSRGAIILLSTTVTYLAFMKVFSGKVRIALILLSIGFTLYLLTSNSLWERGFNRDHVWAIQVASFLEHPLFGIPFDSGTKFGAAENSWLGALSGLGVIGFILLFIFFGLARPRYSAARFGAMKEDFTFVLLFYYSILFSSIFEGFLVGFVNSLIFLLLLMTQFFYNSITFTPRVYLRRRDATL